MEISSLVFPYKHSVYVTLPVCVSDSPCLAWPCGRRSETPTTPWMYSSAFGSPMLPDGAGLCLPPHSQIYTGLEKRFPSNWSCLMKQVPKWNQTVFKKKKKVLRGNLLKQGDPFLEAERMCLPDQRKLMLRKMVRDQQEWQRRMWTRTWIQLLQGFSWPSAGPQPAAC